MLCRRAWDAVHTRGCLEPVHRHHSDCTTMSGYPTKPAKRPNPIAFLQRLKYQYYITFPLYVMTPMERLVLNTFVAICLGLLTTTIYLYFPTQLRRLFVRAYYYCTGMDTESSAFLSSLLSPFAIASSPANYAEY
ncbi:uncharacterized protein V1510DRAFT_305849 [Dipodascopsis tothii]|uniref:uncharacterized protein n=1 Tax=Dipodascopsis tothii TaxID=44089 RepID=UPI0034CD4A12